MLHFLTVGYLDKKSIKRREINPVRPITDEIINLLKQFSDNKSENAWTFEGESVFVTRYYIKCPWYTLQRNRTSEKFAISAKEIFGCTIADIEHGNVLEALK